MIMQSIECERNFRLDYLLSNNLDYLTNLEEKVLSLLDQTKYKVVKKCLEFSKKIEYNHPGQTKNIYLAHPYRVACIYKDIVGDYVFEGIVLSLLHNIYEISSVNSKECKKHFGDNICSGIEILTINRKMQNNHQYLQNYYEKINNSQKYIGQVKILDKLDNLFLLCLNPSESIRLNYLKEINEFVIPIVKTHLPELLDYYISLVDDVREIGYFSIDEYRKKKYDG